jgi:hypothetical protein
MREAAGFPETCRRRFSMVAARTTKSVVSTLKDASGSLAPAFKSTDSCQSLS